MTELVAKSITLVVSTGDADRDRSIEDFIRGAIQRLSPKAPKINVTVVSAYYIIDGKVCLPEDYDPETQDFKPGAGPPPWAGGATPEPILKRVEQEKFISRSPRQALAEVNGAAQQAATPSKRVVRRPAPPVEEKPARRVVRRGR